MISYTNQNVKSKKAAVKLPTAASCGVYKMLIKFIKEFAELSMRNREMNMVATNKNFISHEYVKKKITEN